MPSGVADAEEDVPEFLKDKEPFQFDLYRIPFNDGTGGKPSRSRAPRTTA